MTESVWGAGAMYWQGKREHQVTDLSAPVSLRPPNNPRGLTWNWTRSSVVKDGCSVSIIWLLCQTRCVRYNRGIPTSTNSFSLRHSSRNGSHAAPPSRLTATPSSVCRTTGRATAKPVTGQSNTAEVWVRCQANPCYVCGGRSVTMTSVAPSTSVFPCQYLSLKAVHCCTLHAVMFKPALANWQYGDQAGTDR